MEILLFKGIKIITKTVQKYRFFCTKETFTLNDFQYFEQ